MEKRGSIRQVEGGDLRRRRWVSAGELLGRKSGSVVHPLKGFLPFAYARLLGSLRPRSPQMERILSIPPARTDWENRKNASNALKRVLFSMSATGFPRGRRFPTWTTYCVEGNSEGGQRQLRERIFYHFRPSLSIILKPVGFLNSRGFGRERERVKNPKTASNLTGSATRDFLPCEARSTRPTVPTGFSVSAHGQCPACFVQ